MERGFATVPNLTVSEADFMARALGYPDAVRLLGGDPPMLAGLDRALGGALSTATGGLSQTVLNVFDARGRILGFGRDLAVGLRDRLSGAARVERTRRLEAAHAVIVVTAYFEALDQVTLPFDVRELELTRDDQARLATGATSARAFTALLTDAPPRPAPHLPFERFLTELDQWYGRLTLRLAGFVRGLAVWDRLDETERDLTTTALTEELPGQAVEQYQELFARLCLDIPEFALWTGQIEHQATRRALEGMREQLAALSRAVAPQGAVAALSRAYGAALSRAILSENGPDHGLRQPTLADGYLDSCFRLRPVTGTSRPAEEGWWAEAPVREDLTSYLAGLLTSPGATTAPLLVLGQPGAGKSVLTRALAAQLPDDAFVPVRVVLREVPADMDVQEQIEYAVRDATGERLTWPDIARQAGGALPVVLLDGFDELLQATGVNHSDFLERVARFQQREADQGRPVAALVTSRTAVADRARCPEGTVALRLEPFSVEQITTWVEEWNRCNESYFAAHDLAPLSAVEALNHPELASQPLLLLMLALYDAEDGNALSRVGDALDTTALYERLLTAFARREVAKSAASLSPDQQTGLVEEELQRLSLVAFGMHNRRQQWVSGADLDRDLTALLGRRTATAAVSTFQAPLTPGDAALGRFFFVQRAQALRGGSPLQTYEFLHATFGEYLVARLAMQLATGFLDQRSALRLGTTPVDDNLLYALLSFAPLSSRQLLRFVRGLCERRLADDERSRLVELLVRVLGESATRASHPHPEYRPAALAVSSRHGIYGANLVLLAAALRPGITATELFPHASDPSGTWHRQVLLWRSALSEEDWTELALALDVRHVWRDGVREMLVDLNPDVATVVEPVDPGWHYGYSPVGPGREPAVWARRYALDQWVKTSVSGGTGDSVFLHALQPLLERLDEAVTTFVNAEPSSSLAHDLLELWLTDLDGGDGSDGASAAAYRRVVTFLGAVDGQVHWYACVLLARRLRFHVGAMPVDVVLALATHSLAYPTDVHLQCLVLECTVTALVRAQGGPPDGQPDLVALRELVLETVRTASGAGPRRAVHAWITLLTSGIHPDTDLPLASAVFFTPADLDSLDAEDPSLAVQARRLLALRRNGPLPW